MGLNVSIGATAFTCWMKFIIDFVSDVPVLWSTASLDPALQAVDKHVASSFELVEDGE